MRVWRSLCLLLLSFLVMKTMQLGLPTRKMRKTRTRTRTRMNKGQRPPGTVMVAREACQVDENEAASETMTMMASSRRRGVLGQTAALGLP
jgi:hypothetical protein